MDWLQSRRLHYCFGVVAILFLWFAVLRMVFFFGFSGLDSSALTDNGAVPETLGIGLRFDLRLAILLTLPLAVLAWLPRWNLTSLPWLRWLPRLYLALALAVLMLVYIIDFGHYAYLGVRINATVFRFLGDMQISRDMLWQTYPVVWISLGWVVSVGLLTFALVRLERVTLARPARPLQRWSRVWGSALVVVLVFFGLLGRFENLNLENPVPLRWSDAFFSGDNQVASLGLNPVLFLYDTSSVSLQPYDTEAVRERYELLVNYFGIQQPDAAALNLRRSQDVQPHALALGERKPNVVFVMLESLGASAVGHHGNPLNPTPNIDRLAEESWTFKHFYVPAVGTAKTVWASITGIPDVSRGETSTRNPLIVNQRVLVNALEGYEKFYMIGGNAGWANMNALVRQSIDGVRLYEESYWKSPQVDVWGISDLSLFKEGDELLRAVPKDKPFFAYIQTAGNHRPFTIPKDNDGFQISELTEEQVREYGSVTKAQYEAVRLLDFNIGRLMEIAKAGGWYEDTIFVMFGDHNTRITQLPHMPPAFEKLGIESNHVPMLIHAPKYLSARVFEEATGLSDLWPTLMGLLGIPYETGTMGRDILQPTPEGERVVPLMLHEGTFPVFGGITKDFLLRMNHDGSNPTLHDLASQQPLEDVAQEHPDEFERLRELTRGLYEAARLMLYQNVRD
ncbi:alkaline phosphatase family protein [Pseudomonas sp. RL]|uniref:LTA synthase family protein n=1 Tax=Pseudomonas sp. RL TaxID=1452718 RepID=UPI0004826ECB|nr:alkaline phosphatase family protein [Pseudomonas sp. RL]